MSTDPNQHPSDPEQPREGFGEGEANPEAFPEDEAVGRFSQGVEELPADDPEDAQWRPGAYEQFMRDDDPEDAVYDDFR